MNPANGDSYLGRGIVLFFVGIVIGYGLGVGNRVLRR